MEKEEFEQILLKMDKKIDKLTNLMTKIAKVLHLVPVTEKEERDFQIQQRKNLSQAAKVSEELDAMENKDPEHHDLSGVFDYLMNASDSEILGDVIGDDYLNEQ